MQYFNEDKDSAYDAKVKAQLLSFAPIAFQAARLLRDFGVLNAIEAAGKAGTSLAEIQEKIEGQPNYGVKVLVEAGLGIGLLLLKEGRFHLTKTGYFLLHDEMTRVNMDFTHDVCYRGMFSLEEAISRGKPEGLKGFGAWDTVYQGLASLPQTIKESWFNFDHYYSDLAFPKALPLVFEARPKRILDIGGNTGKWALLCVAHDPSVKVTIVDLPNQIAMAESHIKKQGFDGRIDFCWEMFSILIRIFRKATIPFG